MKRASMLALVAALFGGTGVARAEYIFSAANDFSITNGNPNGVGYDRMLWIGG